MNDQPIAIEPEPGPSWARPHWPLAELDAINLGLDPTQAALDKIGEAAKARAVSAGADPKAVQRRAEDSIRGVMLVRT